MARPYTPKVNKHVTYYDAAGKPRPGTITAIGSTNGGIIIRITHSGQIVGTGAVGILRGPVDINVAQVPNTWRPA